MIVLLWMGCSPVGGPGTPSLSPPNTGPPFTPLPQTQLDQPLTLRLGAGAENLDFLLTPLSDGALALSTRNRRPLAIASVTFTRRQDTLVIEPGELGVLGSIQWSQFEVDLRDTDDDGFVDAAGGFFSGWVLNHEEGFFSNVSGSLTGALDDESGQVVVSGPRRNRETLPTDSVWVEFDEPVVHPSGMRLEMGGVVVGAPFPQPWRDGLSTEVTPLRGPWPFGATLRLEGPPIFDVSDNPLERVPLDIVEDPGQLTGNPGFEDSGGWALSKARAVESADRMVPWNGKFMLEVEQDGAALGYLEVSDQAERLVLELAYAAQVDDPWVQGRSTVSLVTQDGTRELLWTANDRPGETCQTCFTYPYQVDWHTLDVDLIPYRGERIMVLAEIETLVPIPLRNRILIDDVRIVDEAR